MQGQNQDQLFPFRKWLYDNSISVTTGYRLAKDGMLSLTKLRRRSYIKASEAERFMNSLSSQGGQNASR